MPHKLNNSASPFPSLKILPLVVSQHRHHNRWYHLAVNPAQAIADADKKSADHTAAPAAAAWLHNPDAKKPRQTRAQFLMSQIEREAKEAQ